MKIGILGSGDVAQKLCAGLARKGHAVMLGTSQPGKLAAWHAQHAGTAVGSMAEAAAFGELAILAVKGSAAIAALAPLAGALAGKVVIDTTNPIADQPPVDGVFVYFTAANDSLLEMLQREYPALRLVKAWNSVGAAHMVDPAFAGGAPTMFIAGNDAAARADVAALVRQAGWEPADMGRAAAARAIEPLCQLWCLPGLLHNDWSHAFKVLKPA